MVYTVTGYKKTRFKPAWRRCCGSCSWMDWLGANPINSRAGNANEWRWRGQKLREETQFELVNIQENLGITFVVVTHDQEEAMTLASRIGVMDDGKIIQVDEPHALYERPNSRFVADFVGSVNLIEGRADGEILHTEDGPLQIPSAQGEVCFAIRPEKLTIAPKNSDVDALSGTIEDIAYLGNQSIYIVRLG